MLSCDARLLLVSNPRSKPFMEASVHVKSLVPVRVQRLLDDRGRSSLLSSYCSYGERIWES